MKKPNRLAAGERSYRLVTGYLVEATSGTKFETEHDITDEPTQWIDLIPKVEAFELRSVCYWVNPTAAETYRLMLFEGPEADDVESLAKMVFDTGALQADSTLYRDLYGGGELPIEVNLDTEGRLYYNTDWTNPPGNTPGFVVVKGRGLVGVT